MGPGFGGPPPHMGAKSAATEKLRVPKPKNIKEVPSYVAKVISGFFCRLFYIFGLVWETRPWILFVMTFMSIFDGVMPVVGAYITASLLNSLAGAYSSAVAGAPIGLSSVTFMLVMQFLYVFFRALVETIDNVLSRIYGELVVNHIKEKIMNKALDIDLAGFDMPEFYEKLENANNEAGRRPIQILDSVFGTISTIISMVSFIAILSKVSAWAPAVIILMSVPTAIITFIYRNKNFQYIRRRSTERRKLSYFSDLLTNKDMVKEIRIFGLGGIFIGKYKETFQKYFKGLRKLFVSEGVWNVLMSLVTSTVKCLLFLYIAAGVCRGTMQIGDYSLYTGALESISLGVATFISTTATIYEGTLFIDNMITFMNEKKRIVPSIAAPADPMRHTPHTIEFKNVSFRYPGTERDVIKNVSFKIEAGQSVVLVGLNGAGKTTLIKLITRLYDPTEGVVLLDGRDIREYDVDELYRMYGIIFQDFGKYAVTVTENVSFGDKDRPASPESVKEAAKNSGADGFISRLPKGYDTPLMRIFEESGIELSVGQWQKLSVARAFYSDSDILILDEPTASLDAIAEQEIYNRFDVLGRGKITIFVSHRLSSATTADKIIVLEYGEIIEEGNHHELMEKHGRYFELFSTQASRYTEHESSDCPGEMRDMPPQAPPPRPHGFEPGTAMP